MEHFIAETNKVYAKQNIKKLTDKEATKKGIVTQIKWLLDGAQPGDQLLFHYSGHGAQVPTLNQNLELDGLDEIICPYDFSGQGENAFPKACILYGYQIAAMQKICLETYIPRRRSFIGNFRG
jgi:hypothetical protein